MPAGVSPGEVVQTPLPSDVAMASNAQHVLMSQTAHLKEPSPVRIVLLATYAPAHAPPVFARLGFHVRKSGNRGVPVYKIRGRGPRSRLALSVLADVSAIRRAARAGAPHVAPQHRHDICPNRHRLHGLLAHTPRRTMLLEHAHRHCHIALSSHTHLQRVAVAFALFYVVLVSTLVCSACLRGASLKQIHRSD